MKKVVIQVFIAVGLFFAMWYLLAQINWIDVFGVDKAKSKTEENLGNLFWEDFKRFEKENEDSFVINSVDSILSKICDANNIERELIKLHILNKNEVNAFALPDGHLIIYSGLISTSLNQEELSGVICHELAHIELNHVMQKLVREVGLSVLMSIATGNRSSETVGETARILSSSAFDRSMEKEADIKAVDYLIAANINPEPFADFLYKIAVSEGDAATYLSWLSTHPESTERAEYIIEYSRDKDRSHKSILSDESWQRLKESLNESVEF